MNSKERTSATHRIAVASNGYTGTTTVMLSSGVFVELPARESEPKIAVATALRLVRGGR